MGGSSGENEDNSTYLESTEKSPETKNTNSDLLDLIKETGNIHEVVKEDLEEIHLPRVIFNQNNDLDPVDLLEEEATQTETPPDNGWNPPLLNKFPYQSSW